MIYIGSIAYGTVYPAVQAAYEGGRAAITCHSAKGPIWYKDGLLLNAWRSKRVLEFPRVTIKQHNGVYSCIGSYFNGETFTASSELLVGGAM